MRPEQIKIIKILIENAVKRNDYTHKTSFLILFKNLLKEINDSLNNYSKSDNVKISDEEKEQIIASELKPILNETISRFYKDINEPKSGMGFGKKSDSDEDDFKYQNKSDDPTGPTKF